jgi:DNA-binding FadR family transcriptional regulator
MLTMLSEGEDLSGAEKVFAFFRDALLDGSLKPGERLLSERELSLRLGVSRPLLREALRSLAMLGFLDIQHGKGAYVRQADINVLSDFFTFSLARQPDILDDVMQARIAIECQAIRLACERATEGDLKRIGSKLTRLMDTLHDPVEGGIADFAFHQALVEASHSEALTTLYGAIGELLRRSHVQRREVTVLGVRHRRLPGRGAPGGVPLHRRSHSGRCRRQAPRPFRDRPTRLNCRWSGPLFRPTCCGFILRCRSSVGAPSG